MLRYTAIRILLLIPTMLLASTAVFLTMRLVPGDPAQAVLGAEASAERVAQAREEMGLNDPVLVQYGRFLRGLVAGDLGTSYRTHEPVWNQVKRAVPASLELNGAGMMLAVLFGIPLGVVAAVNRNTWVDSGTMVIAMVAVSMPIFLLGLLLMRTFAAKLHWFPATGRGTLAHLVLPAFTIGLTYASGIARMTRATVVEVLLQDFVRTARAKGLAERVILYRHTLRNAMIPIATVTGSEFSRLLGGAVITEAVFAYPGLGRMLVDAVRFRDYPVAQGGVLVLAGIIILVNLLVDLSYGALDPRVRYA